MRKLIVLGVIAAALTTAACNTVAGVGRDVSAVGQAVASSSERAKN
ncbi:entericidin A/B family lipoprotein [Brevundimonas diminuta]|nr:MULTISPECIES: entericidin A/B family lipoprotein [Brevundimonas]EKY29346.1 entericidin EcnA/B family protein [Brevundimonas diminuta 470-4]MCO8018203.1 entericidin A/B family lipoprotein [Brevundimonas diminuta]MCO8022273.1 entericidin A/B family lipoprotein [Brevundimonas diminuta]HBV11820.1 entericidin, EcnA/B family [Brevundimonas sp.]